MYPEGVLMLMYYCHAEACLADQVTTSTGTPGPARDGLESGKPICLL